MYSEGEQEKALHGMAEEEMECGGSIWGTEKRKVRGARAGHMGDVCYSPSAHLLSAV